MASASHRCGHLLNRRDDAFGLAPPNCFPSTSTSVARTGIQPASTAPGTPGCSPPRTPYSTRCDAVATERPACMAAYNAALTDAKTVKRLTTNTPPPPSLAPPGPPAWPPNSNYPQPGIPDAFGAVDIAKACAVSHAQLNPLVSFQVWTLASQFEFQRQLSLDTSLGVLGGHAWGLGAA